MSKYIHQGKKRLTLGFFTNCGYGVNLEQNEVILDAIMSSRMASTNPLDPSSIHVVS